MPVAVAGNSLFRKDLRKPPVAIEGELFLWPKRDCGTFPRVLVAFLVGGIVAHANTVVK